MNRLVILDRDGVVNQDSDAFIKTLDEFVLLPNTVAAIVALKKAGYKVAIASNQSGIARGLLSRSVLHGMHDYLQRCLSEYDVAVDWIVYSPYVHDTPCRKPNAGLYHAIAWRFGLSSLKGVTVIGDSWRDLVAAMAVGAVPILVMTGKGEKTLVEQGDALSEHQVPVTVDLLAAVRLMGVDA